MPSDAIRSYEGTFDAPKDATFAIVASRFNHFIVDRLVDGALDALRRHGVADARIIVARTPGSFEIPLVCSRFATAAGKRKVDAVIAIGAVIRGATPHFDYVAAEVTKGCASVMLETGVPIACGVLTTDSIEQAIERAGTKGGNKGWDAAMSALEMVSLGRRLAADGM